MIACLIVGLAAAALAQPESMVINGRFDGLRGWETEPGAAIVERSPGDRCLKLGVGANQYVAVLPAWHTLTVALDMRVEEIEQHPDGFAYAAIYQYDADGNITTFCHVMDSREPTDWQRHEKTFELAPTTTAIRIRLGFFRAKGTALYDNVTLVEGEVAAGIDEVGEWAGRDRLGEGVLVWEEPGLPLPAGGVEPAWVERALRNAGLSVRRADSEALAEALRPADAGLLVLPYGPAFPHACHSRLINYCRAGGRLLVIGGYPLNAPMVRREGRWVNLREELARERQERLAWPNNLLADGGFEHSADAPLGGQEPDAAWHRDIRCDIVQEDAPEGSSCATVEAPRDEKDVIERRWYAFVPAGPQREYRFSCRIRTEGVQGDGIAFAAVYEYQGDKLVKPHDAILLRGDNPWQETVLEFTTQPDVDRLYVKLGLYRVTGRAWFDQAQLVDCTGLRYHPLNTSSGKPGDWLQFAPEQMAMCDVGSPLRRAVSVAPTPGQRLLSGPRRRGPLQGWMASGLTGLADARWVPLLDACDRYGRLRGAAAAMLLHYGGFYSGSLWAYFSVENTGLFGPGERGSDGDLVRLVRWLQRGCFLHSIRGDQDLYRPDEPVAVRVQLTNAGGPPFHGLVRLIALSKGDEVSRTEAAADLPTWESTEVPLRLPPAGSATGLLELRAQLLAEGQVIDEAPSGVVIGDEARLRAGPRLDWRENYLRLNGRPTFLFGSDNWCDQYGYSEMNPLRWSRLHAAARDLGVQVYENLQYSNPDYRMKEADWRRFEAMAQLLGQRGMVFMPCLLVGHNVAVDDQQLAVEGRQCREYAERLGSVPGLLWYLNGDFQFRIDDLPWARRAWNEWLSAEYGDEARVAAAWGLERLPAALGQLDFPPPTTLAWDDPVAVDRTRFDDWVMRRWIEHHIAQVRAVERERPITSEYYAEPSGSIDLRLSLGSHSISNFGYFAAPEDDLRAIPERLAINDMRYTGQGVSVGEYGVKISPAFGPDMGATGYYVARTEERQQQLFLSMAAYALGMGACKVQNWSLRDEGGAASGWGILHNERELPKDVAYTHRNLSLLWRLLEPRYEPPETSILCPTPLRVGNHAPWGALAVYSAAQGLLRLHLPFAVADDFAVSRLPAATKTLIWPAAAAASDRDWAAVMAWVEAGGQLVASGYPGWDDRRRPVTRDRLGELLGITGTTPIFPGVDRKTASAVRATVAGTALDLRPQAAVAAPADARIVLSADNGTPLILSRPLGRGAVVWIADPVELEQDRARIGDLVAVYRVALGALPQPPEPIPVEPDDPGLHVTRQRTASGWVWAVNAVEETAPATVGLPTPAGRVELRVRPWWPQAVMVSDDGKLLMALADGALCVDGQPLVADGPPVGLASLDGQDLRRSEVVMLCPFGSGQVALSGLPSQGKWGEWRDGRWASLEHIQVPGQRLEIDEDQQTCVALLCRGNTRRWQRHLTRLVTQPWTVPGY